MPRKHPNCERSALFRPGADHLIVHSLPGACAQGARSRSGLQGLQKGPGDAHVTARTPRPARQVQTGTRATRGAYREPGPSLGPGHRSWPCTGARLRTAAAGEKQRDGAPEAEDQTGLPGQRRAQQRLRPPPPQTERRPADAAACPPDAHTLGGSPSAHEVSKATSLGRGGLPSVLPPHHQPSPGPPGQGSTRGFGLTPWPRNSAWGHEAATAVGTVGVLGLCLWSRQRRDQTQGRDGRGSAHSGAREPEARPIHS